jgi:hypothetical protein
MVVGTGGVCRRSTWSAWMVHGGRSAAWMVLGRRRLTRSARIPLRRGRVVTCLTGDGGGVCGAAYAAPIPIPVVVTPRVAAMVAPATSCFMFMCDTCLVTLAVHLPDSKLAVTSQICLLSRWWDPEQSWCSACATGSR